jgi:3-hydroxyisobutyrate dehydrogenase-like beta-hydroxyacid dehydrogenase
MRRKSRKNVGLIGLGIIGSRAAAGLRAAGYRVFVWNRSAKPIPNFLGTPAEVAEVCEIIQIFVSDAAALMEVLGAMKSHLTAQHVIVCNATVGPEATAEAAKFVQATGASFLDAPFTGSKVAADARQLVYYVGGDEAVYLRVKPVLEATSKAIVRVGGIGDAATIKVVTNLISAASVQVLSEALALVSSAGLPPEALAAALEHNAAKSGVIELKLPKMLSADYEPHFSLKHMHKDVKLGLQLASELKVDVPVTAATESRMVQAVNGGWADDDFAVVYRTYQGGAPVPVLMRGSVQPALAGGDSAADASAADRPAPTPARIEPAVPPLETPKAAAPSIFPEKPVELQREPAAGGSERDDDGGTAPVARPPHIFARAFVDEESPAAAAQKSDGPASKDVAEPKDASADSSSAAENSPRA